MKKEVKTTIRALLKLLLEIFLLYAFCWAEVCVVGFWLEAWEISSSDQSLNELFVLLLELHIACLIGRGLIKVIIDVIRRPYWRDRDEELEGSPGPELETGTESPVKS